MPEFNPYEAPAAPLENPSSIQPQEPELADRGTRLAAKILDGFIWGAALIVPMVMLFAAIAERHNAQASLGFLVLAIVLLTVASLGVLIWNLLWLHRHGQTIAKRICGVRIVRGDGERASLGRLVGLRFFLPWIVGWVPLFGPLFGLTNILSIFREDRRCLHDLMADTMVVKA